MHNCLIVHRLNKCRLKKRCFYRAAFFLGKFRLNPLAASVLQPPFLEFNASYPMPVLDLR